MPWVGSETGAWSPGALGKRWTRKPLPTGAVGPSWGAGGGDVGFGLRFPQAWPLVAGKCWAMCWQPLSAIGHRYRGLPSPRALPCIWGSAPASHVETMESWEPLSRTPQLGAVLVRSSRQCSWVRPVPQHLQILLMHWEGEDANPCVRPELIQIFPKVRVPLSTPAFSEFHTESCRGE